jgi:alpha-glucosidase
LGRDGCRTPMQWDASDKTGFTNGDPWLPLGGDHRQLNVENQRADRTSIFTLHRRLIALRRAHPALALGDYRPMAAAGDLLLFQRVLDRERFVVALNLGAEPIEVDFTKGEARGRLVLSTHGDRDGEVVADALALRDNEGVVIELS